MWGTIGLIYNIDRIHAIMPDAPVRSLDMILRPDLASRFSHCGISVLDSWVDMVPLISRYLGQPDLAATPASIGAVAERFGRVRPYIRRMTNTGYYDQLARGELCLSIGYSADAMVARRDAEEFGSGVRIGFSHALETVPMYVDAFAIPADARNVSAAHRFIDFALRADIAARLATATGFTVANSAAIAALSPELRDNPIIYPPAEVRARLALGRGYSMDETREYSRTWLRMRTGH
jgi:putrescine transport system substrate-binding protein